MFILQIWRSKDIPSAILLAVIVGVSIWITALPLSSSVQETYLRRFHLASPNFATWAVQQPVPAMYNFENRVWVSPIPASSRDLHDSIPSARSNLRSRKSENQENKIETDPVNHFPTRYFTFGQSRQVFRQNPSWYFYLRSRYRDREIRSTYKISPVSETEVQVNRLEVTVD